MVTRRTVLATMSAAVAQLPLGSALGSIAKDPEPASTGVGPLLPSPPIALKRFMGHRYGAFIHWGPATVLGREISWTRQVKTPYREYDALYKQFNPTEFDAEAWIRALLDGGFRYLTFVTKHHEGFAMWDTKTTDHNIMRSPFGRDVLKEIYEACKKLKLPLCLYYSIADFYHPDCIGAAAVGEYSADFYKPDPTKPIDVAAEYFGPPGYDLPPGQKPDFDRYVHYMKAQLRELTENYGPVLGWWFDGGWQKIWTYERGVDLLKYLRSLQADTLTDQRVGCAFNNNIYMPTWFPTDKKHVGDYAVLEVDMPRFNRDIPWEYTTPANNRSYCWTPGPYGDPSTWIENLVKSACGDGNYILGVSAPATGRFEPELTDKLKEANGWLRRYGESIYETRGGVYKRTNVYGSTCKGNKVYLHLFDTTATKLVLPPLPSRILSSKLLNGGSVKVAQTDQAVTVEIDPFNFELPTTVVVMELSSNAELITPIGETPVNRNASVKSSNSDPSSDRFASDGDMSTYWKADGQTSEPWLEYDLGSEKTISRAILFEGEYEGECSNIHKLQIEVKVQDQWKAVTVGPSADWMLTEPSSSSSPLLTTWGNGEPPFDDWPISILHPEIRFARVKARFVRLRLVRVTGRPVIHEFELYER